MALRIGGGIDRIRDPVYASIVSLTGLTLVRSFFVHEFLATGYEDWLYQAFRIKLLQEYGYVNWLHDWYCGFPPWQSYPLVPHIGARIVTCFGISITRSMAILTGILFAVLLLETYLFQRRYGTSPEASLASSLLLIGVLRLYSDMRDYAIFYGVAIFPLILLALDQAFETRKARYFVLSAIVLGGSIYVHPFATILGFLAMILLGLFFYSDIASTGILTLSSMLIGGGLLIPSFINNQIPNYGRGTLGLVSTDIDSVRLTMMEYGGLGLPLLILGPLAFFSYPLVQRDLDVKKRRLAKWLLILSAFIAVTIVGTYYQVPPFTWVVLQVSRFPSYLGFSLCPTVGVLLDSIQKSEIRVRTRISSRHLRIAAYLLMLVPIVFSYQSAERHVPSCTNDPYLDEIGEWINQNPSVINCSTRILVSRPGATSLFAFGRFRGVTGYYDQGSYNPFFDELKWLFFSVDPYSPYQLRDFHLIELYLKAFAVQFVVIDSNSPIANALTTPEDPFYRKMEVVDRTDAITVFKTPWRAVENFHTASATAVKPFPSYSIQTEQEHQKLNQWMEEYVDQAYSNEAMSISAEYPSPEKIVITIDDLPLGRHVVVAENYDDGNWICEVKSNDSEANFDVNRIGPNFIGFNLEKITGYTTIHLEHKTPVPVVGGVALTLLAIPVCLLLHHKAISRGRLRTTAPR